MWRTSRRLLRRWGVAGLIRTSGESAVTARGGAGWSVTSRAISFLAPNNSATGYHLYMAARFPEHPCENCGKPTRNARFCSNGRHLVSTSGPAKRDP